MFTFREELKGKYPIIVAEDNVMKIGKNEDDKLFSIGSRNVHIYKKGVNKQSITKQNDDHFDWKWKQNVLTGKEECELKRNQVYHMEDSEERIQKKEEQRKERMKRISQKKLKLMKSWKRKRRNINYHFQLKSNILNNWLNWKWKKFYLILNLVIGN